MQFQRPVLIFAAICLVSCVGAAADSSHEKAIKEVFTAFSASWDPPPDPQQEKPTAQPDHHLVGCPDSPTPGKRPPDTGCAILAHKIFNALPKAPVVLRLENFPTTEAAQNSATPAGAVVETAGKIWLLTLGSQGERSKAGSFVKEIGPLPEIPVATSYELQIADADFGPAMNPVISKAVHTHSGPEIWYSFTGQQCLETPNGIQSAKAGEGMFAPAGTPMQLNITGTGNREALFAIVHDAAKPATTVSDWQPKGSCQKSTEAQEADNMDVVKKWYGLLDEQAFDSWSNLFREDSRNFIGSSQQSFDHRAIVPAVKMIYAAFPDFSHKIQNIFASRDYVVAQVLCTGTHLKPYMGIPPTNNRVEYKETFIFKMKNGKIDETYGMVETLTMMKQLGLELK